MYQFAWYQGRSSKTHCVIQAEESVWAFLFTEIKVSLSFLHKPWPISLVLALNASDSHSAVTIVRLGWKHQKDSEELQY